MSLDVHRVHRATNEVLEQYRTDVRPDRVARETLAGTLRRVARLPEARRGAGMLGLALLLASSAAPLRTLYGLASLAGLAAVVLLSVRGGDVAAVRHTALLMYVLPTIAEVVARSALCLSVRGEGEPYIAAGIVATTLVASAVSLDFDLDGAGRARHSGAALLALSGCVAARAVLRAAAAHGGPAWLPAAAAPHADVRLVLAAVLVRFALCAPWALGGVGSRVGPAARDALGDATRRAALAPLKSVCEDEILHAAFAKCMLEYWKSPSTFNLDDAWPLLISSIAFVGAGAAAAGAGAAAQLELRLCDDGFDADRAADMAVRAAEDALAQMRPPAAAAHLALLVACAPTCLAVALARGDQLLLGALCPVLLVEAARLHRLLAASAAAPQPGAPPADGLEMLLRAQPGTADLFAAYRSAKAFAAALGSPQCRATLRGLQTSARARSLALGVARLSCVTASAYASGGDGGVASATSLALALANEARLLAGGSGDALRVLRDARVVSANAARLWAESGAAEYAYEGGAAVLGAVPTEPTWWAWTSAYVGSAAAAGATGMLVAGPVGAVVGIVVGSVCIAVGPRRRCGDLWCFVASPRRPAVRRARAPL
ncbi:hypothetical protein M885DRAFT_537386 [Pelagophyceae sp. CCMP2097]|nr:hypothetical protein M885DRAFT_537386 [Pelagophyceae sp. CCMP2097]